MEFLIEKAIDTVLESSGLKENVSRNQHVIRILQRLGISSVESLTTFEDVYAYAVVEYAFDTAGQCKPKLLVSFFKLKEVRELFQAVYRQNEPEKWLLKGEAIAQFKLGNQLPELDLKLELGTFAVVFSELVKQTRSPKEIRQDQKLDSLQQQLQVVQSQIQELPSLGEIYQTVNQLVGSESLSLPVAAQNSNAADLARRLDEWFKVLNYERDLNYEVWTTDYFEWMINFPVSRRRFSRTLVRGVDGAVEMDDLEDFRQKIQVSEADEGWLVGNRRVSKAVRLSVRENADYQNIASYTFDELLDEDADFSQYLDWLEAEIKRKGVDTEYIPLACRKDELNPFTQQKIGVSTYGEDDGWIDGYVDMWLDDPAKEHLSVLGEFGTGKTWFALHYAWVALQRYKNAKKRGIDRPRVPIVVPLRDYARSVRVESLFSEFFFREHEILKNYSVFDRLNRMGKLLLIFDGFDEMAARVNRQEMIDNFWELAKVVVPGAKAILTCRTEHFPNAMEGRQLLNAELKASTDNRTGEPPQFEVLEIEKLSNNQIAEMLGKKAKVSTVQTVMENSQLLDLARRPVMVDLILEALPEIEEGKPVDMARVYLYAVTRKMERDIASKRTFTSLADKLYFLCEVSWEMLSTNQLSLNYLAFPERLQRMFPHRAREEKLDHWRYDMMGQTMLIRNSAGDYSPAHRSLLEFFVAYKIVASLGAMAEDFVEVARQSSGVVKSSSRDYTWEDYFERRCDSDRRFELNPRLQQFKSGAIKNLLPLLKYSKLTKAVLDLAHPMLEVDSMQKKLLPLLQATREVTIEQAGYLGGNIAQLMLAKSPYALVNSDLSRTNLRGVDFTNAYLRRVSLRNSHLEEVLFLKVIGTINSVTFSQDGRHLAIGDSKGSLQIWNAVTGQLVLFLSGHTNMVRSVKFSPDGKLLASGSVDKTVKLWSLADGKCILTLEGHTDFVESIAFSPDGETIASGSGDNTVKLWLRHDGSCVCTLRAHLAGVASIAFSPNGETIASSSWDNTIKLWETNSQKCIQTLEDHSEGVFDISFSPDGQMLASGSDDNTVKLWSVVDGRCVRTFEGHKNFILSVAFDSTGQTLASGSYDKTIKLWSISNGKCIRTLEGHTNGIVSVEFSPDGKTIASGSDDRTMKLWSVSNGNCLYTLGSHANLILSVAFSSDGQMLASGSYDNTVKLWSVNSGKCIRTLEGHENGVWSVAFSPDGKTLASGSYDNTVKLWSVNSGKCIRTLEGHTDGLWSVAFSPDGQTLASGSSDDTVKWWSVATYDCLQTVDNNQNWVRTVAFSPDGKSFAHSGDGTNISVSSVTDYGIVFDLRGHSAAVLSTAFEPGSKILASGSYDNTIKLWSMENGECLHTLEGHKNGVWSVAFSVDGQTLVSGSADNTVKLWSVESGVCIRTLTGHSDWVRSVAFSSHGAVSLDKSKEIIASGSDDETIRFWDIKTGECLRVIDEWVCEGLDITGAMGLTAGQKKSLKLMGAVDDNA